MKKTILLLMATSVVSTMNCMEQDVMEIETIKKEEDRDQKKKDLNAGLLKKFNILKKKGSWLLANRRYPPISIQLADVHNPHNCQYYHLEKGE